MIVVAGGSGLLGRHVVSDLLARGEQVRVLVRDPERARTVLGEGVEVLAGDVRQTAALGDVVAGASVIVSAVHGLLGGRGAGPLEVDQRGNANLVDAAAASGTSVVLVSVIGAAADSPLELFRAKHAAEQHLRASGTPWTIVRAGPFLETWLTILTQTAGRSGRPLVFGRGDRPLGFVSAADVAAVVARAATDATLRGQILEVAGEPVTMTALARALQCQRGWHGAVRHVPRPVLRTLGTLARPVYPAFARKNRTAVAMDKMGVATRTEAVSLLGRAPLTASDVLALLGPTRAG
ncbi:MAG: SDR family oxidoreductase [Jatrophihabitans sp.]